MSRLTRRQVLNGAVLATVGVALPEPPVMSQEQPVDAASILALPLAEIAARLQRGSLSAAVCAAAVLAAARRRRDLNAYATLAEDVLLAAARALDTARGNSAPPGALYGVPLILKDNINTRALPTSGGTPGLAGNRPGADAAVARRLFDAGALLAGKANMHELSSGGTSDNHTFGRVANPYGADRTPGGSSGGTAAAVAARLVPGGLGTDTAGSVRVPAALCGVVGLRPTSGRYPGAGIIPLSSSLDTAGPMARSVPDVALLDGVITGENHAAPLTPPAPDTLTLGVPYESHVDTASTAVAGVFTPTLQRLADAGVTLVPVDLSEIRDLTRAAAAAVIDYEFPDVMASYLEAYAPTVSLARLAEQVRSPAARRLTMERLAKARDSAAYDAARRVKLPQLQQAHRALHGALGIDALAFPTTPDIALPHGGDDNVLRDGQPVLSWFYFNNTSMASIAGNPSLTLPAGLSAEALPVGLCLDGLPNSDRSLLAIGLTLETVLGPLPAPPA